MSANPLHRYHRLLIICALISLTVMVARQMGLSGATRLYLSTARQTSTDYVAVNATDTVNNTTAPEFAPIESWHSGYRSNGSFKIVYPRLYASLTRLVGTPVAVNWTAPTGVKACARPAPHNMAADLLSAHRLQATSSSTADGGLWAPRNCWPPLSRTAVIVPYRNRSDNLDTFVPYMRQLLERQNVLFGLFVVEQANARLFNRAKLLNVGFQVAQKFHGFDCFVFQDADKVPENVANVYDCAHSPKLLISEMRSQGDATNKYKPGKLYYGFFGGTVAIGRDAFLKVNGNSNQYYGWGREDDELSARLGLAGYQIRYNAGPEARFVNLGHSQDIVVNTMPWPYVHKVREKMRSDGLNSLNYTDIGIYLHPMFVLVRVDV